MKKAIGITFIAALVLVNLIAWLVGIYSEVEIGVLFRLALIMGITFIATIFAGAGALVRALQNETPSSK